MPSTRSVAPAFDWFPNLRSSHTTFTIHSAFVLFTTFLAYASIHASRKPPSIVKSVLGPTMPENSSSVLALNETGWAPFDGPGGTQLLGMLDVAFLSAYAIGMYFAGHVGDRIDLRLFLVFGMMGSGVFTILFGLGYWLDIHTLWFFFSVQVLCGLFQSIGWPCVVAIVGNWRGREKKGLIMGAWNSHTSVGNIIGSVVASKILKLGWGWAFAVPGALVISVGFFVFLFLVVSPNDIGFETPGRADETESNAVGRAGGNTERVDETESNTVVRAGGNTERVDETESNTVGRAIENIERADETESNTDGRTVEITGSLDSEEVRLIEHSDSMAAIGFLEAWKLPDVAPFAICLFFSKLVVYTFMYWLPFYITHTAVAGEHLLDTTAGMLSMVFDLGGLFGGILAGFISDLIDARAVTSVTFLILSIPALILYRCYGEISMVANVCLMLLSGLLVNGPYSLISTAVAADLGTQSQSTMRGNSQALATVSAIIDGTGSVGAAIGPLLVGYVSSKSWGVVFIILCLSNFIAALTLFRLALKEIRRFSSTEREVIVA